MLPTALLQKFFLDEAAFLSAIWRVYRMSQHVDSYAYVSINAEGHIFLQETMLDLEALVPRLLAVTDNNQDVRIFVRGDKAIDYGRVMEVMGTVNSAGFRKVALITEHMSGPSIKKKAE